MSVENGSGWKGRGNPKDHTVTASQVCLKTGVFLSRLAQVALIRVAWRGQTNPPWLAGQVKGQKGWGGLNEGTSHGSLCTDSWHLVVLGSLCLELGCSLGEWSLTLARLLIIF